MSKNENNWIKEFPFGDFFKEVFDEFYDDSAEDYKDSYEDYLDALSGYTNGCHCNGDCKSKEKDKKDMFNETKMMFASLPKDSKVTFDGKTLSFDGGNTCVRVSYEGNWNNVVKAIIAKTTKKAGTPVKSATLNNEKDAKKMAAKELARAKTKEMIEEIKSETAKRKIELILLGKKQYEWIKTFNDGKDIKDVLGYPIYKSNTEDYFKIV